MQPQQGKGLNRKGTDRPRLGAIASSPNSDADKTKYTYSTERHQSKNKYRPQHAQVVEKRSPSPSQAYYVDQRPYNGYATPRSDESRTRRSTIKELCKGSTRQRCHKVMDKVLDGEQKKSYSQSQNPYVTPSSPDFSTVRARQRRKCKDVARQKHHLDGDSTLLRSRAVSQPISLRLRSSKSLHGKRIL